MVHKVVEIQDHNMVNSEDQSYDATIGHDVSAHIVGNILVST